jgi:hypothetical protein
MYVKATLVKLVTDDGITDMCDHVKVGDMYLVDPDRIRTLVWGREGQPKVRVPRPSIFVAANENGAEGWMPLELLKLEKN